MVDSSGWGCRGSFGRFYAALRRTPMLLKIGNVWPRDRPGGPGNPGARSASGAPGKACHFYEPRSGSFSSGSRQLSAARVPDMRRVRNASHDVFAAESSPVRHMRWAARPFSGSEVTYVSSWLACVNAHRSNEDTYVTSDPENGCAVHLT